MSQRNWFYLGRGENSIYEIDLELRESCRLKKQEAIIADIRDRKKLDQVFSQFQPEVVFHAAAHKHVHFMEQHPDEAVKNNVFGTQNVARAAMTWGTSVFVLIFTDKAVNPTSVMGATKRIAEAIVQDLARQGDTKFVVVRFGNVDASPIEWTPRSAKLDFWQEVLACHVNMIESSS
jgi:FlaA1/EpsC-like NDP-sugar epimerase